MTDAIALPEGASMGEYQRYVRELEAMHGWTEVDLVHNCFLMGEEVGELFKAVRRHNRLFDQAERSEASAAERKAEVADELVDVFNYLVAIANRLDIDFEQAFRAKNAKNQARRWE